LSSPYRAFLFKDSGQFTPQPAGLSIQRVLEDDACGECICFKLCLLLDVDAVAEQNDNDDVIFFTNSCGRRNFW
jgi:hypothetical protein